MKNKFLFAILFLAFYNLSAQDTPLFQKTTIQNFNKQYSVKATAILENSLSSNPYQFAIKTLGRKSNKRLALGFNLRAQSAEDFKEIASGIRANIRFGKERFTDFGKSNKCRIFYGLDYLAGANIQSSGTRTNLLFNGGISPFAGLQYRLNKRLILYTETNYSFVLSGLANNDLRLSFGSNFHPPISVWVGFELFK